MGCTTSQQVWNDNHRDMQAMYNKRLGRHNDKTHIDTDGEDLQQLLGDEGFSDVWHPFIPVEMTDYTDTEIGKFLFFRFSPHGKIFVQNLFNNFSTNWV